MALDHETKRTDHKTSSIGRIEALTKEMMKTVNDASTDFSPILTAIGNELLVEAKADLPNIAEQLRRQIIRPLPGRESRPRQARSGKE
jgi:hypothetical protein